jgi:citrate synthase
VFAAAWARQAVGLAPVAPDPAFSHAGDYWRMVHDATPTAAVERALGTYLVTVADHGMNASTFAARVVASTGSDAVSAAVAGIGALKGPLHGGAPGPVLDMLDAIGEPERARAWLEAELAAGRRIMGMGHRVYRVRDPRAAVLERALEALARDGGASERLPLARAVERAAVELLRGRYPERALQTNVEFYTAVLLDALGFERRLFSPTFAVGRVVGWYAHVLEQRATGRLIRPASRYVGPEVLAEGEGEIGPGLGLGLGGGTGRGGGVAERSGERLQK